MAGLIPRLQRLMSRKAKSTKGGSVEMLERMRKNIDSESESMIPNKLPNLMENVSWEELKAESLKTQAEAQRIAAKKRKERGQP